MKNKLLKIIYAFSLTPLVFGSITFFYWYYNRIWFASDVDIELTAFFTILAYFLFGLIALILCSVYAFKQKDNWKKIITPVIIVLITFPTVDLYSSVHTSFEQKAFVSIVNDVNKTEIIRIRSDNFEDTYFDNKKDFIFSYYPVYTYDWTQAISGNWYNHDLNKIRIEIKMENDKVQTFDFPNFSKGQCGTVRISEIIKKE
ncbi:MAG: hypothetical protein AB8F74_12520 [Saprospiraceae bacterium]